VLRNRETSEASFTTEATALPVVGSNPKIVFPELLVDPDAKTVRTSLPRLDFWNGALMIRHHALLHFAMPDD
jgi:hypothetical protein